MEANVKPRMNADDPDQKKANFPQRRKDAEKIKRNLTQSSQRTQSKNT